MKFRITRLIIFVFVVFGLLQGCASSELSRGTAGSVDQAYIDATSGRGQIDVANTYQNTSQTTKGVLIGGVAGGVIGGLTNGVGVVAGAVTGAILVGALGAYIDAHSTLVDKLINRQVQVFMLGDQVMLVMNSNRIFLDGTTSIRNSAYSTLDLVSQLIGNCVNMSVKVAAYSNDSGVKSIDCSRTQEQAENVAKYLWKRCINTRFLYAEGYGGTHLITTNEPGSYCNENNRIEITFEKLPA